MKQRVINHLRDSNVSLLKTKIANVLDRAYKDSSKIVTNGIGPLLEESKQKKVKRKFGSMSSMNLGNRKIDSMVFKKPQKNQVLEESNSILSSSFTKNSKDSEKMAKNTD